MKASNLRLANQRLILRHLQRNGGDSKAAIAESCHISKPTAGKIIDELLEAGVLQPCERHEEASEPALGRPSQMVGLDQERPRFVLIELGVRQVHCRLVSLAGDERERHSFATPDSTAALQKMLNSWWQEMHHDGLWAAVIAVPGVVDEQRAHVLKSPNLPWTEGHACLAAIADTLGLPLYPVQEIRALALSHLQTAQAPSSFLYVHSQDGLGAALVLDQQLFTGASALSAELGHTPIKGNMRPCGCGNRGCLETLAAGPGLMHSYAVSDWQALATAMAQDPQALDEALEHVAVHIAASVNVSGVKHVILGARFESFPQASLDKLITQIQAACLWSQFGAVHIALSDVGFSQGLLAYVFEHAVLETSDWSKPCQRQIA